MVGNYPPGAANDPRAPYNQPDRSHDHEWEAPHDPDEVLIIEDGAAIFHDRCMYVEGRYGEGWECEEERTYRFEYDTLDTPDGDTIDLPTIDNWDSVDADTEEIVRKLETNRHTDDVKLTGVDPHPDGGSVTLDGFGYQLTYSADAGD